MKVDLELMVMRLILEQEGTAFPPANCSEYLIDDVCPPLVRGECVPFAAIDYTAFDEDDIWALWEYNETVYRIAQALGRAAERIGTIAPVARPVRQYC